jgi:hypothetical protein
VTSKVGKIYALPVSLFILLLAVPVCAGTKVKIATVPDEFTPYAGAGLPQPVSMSGYYFEVNKETGRARVVVQYTYRDQAVLEGYDAHQPDPTYAQIAGLVYDPSAHAVLYAHDGQKTICATVEERRTRGVANPKVKATGSCTITAARAEHIQDDGWKARRIRVIDVYFEVR